MSGMVHATADWDETLCDLEIRFIGPPDGVLGEELDPAERAPELTPCERCYPPGKDRTAFYAAWAKRRAGA